MGTTAVAEHAVTVTGFVPNVTRTLYVSLPCADACPAEVSFAGLPVAGSPGSELDASRRGLDAAVDGGRDAGLDAGPPATERVVIADGSFAPIDRFGAAIAMDRDGSRILVGVPAFDAAGPFHGGGTAMYDPAGARLWFFGHGGRHGAGVALTHGVTCSAVVGAPEYGVGIATVDEPRGAWFLVGCADGSMGVGPLDPAVVRADASGESVAISADGTRTIAGAPGVGASHGYVSIAVNGVYVSRALDLDGTTPYVGGGFGASVAMADDGTALVGAPRLGASGEGGVFAVDRTTNVVSGAPDAGDRQRTRHVGGSERRRSVGGRLCARAGGRVRPSRWDVVHRPHDPIAGILGHRGGARWRWIAPRDR